MEFNANEARRNISIEFVEKDYSRFAVFPVVISYLLDHLHLNREFNTVLKTHSPNMVFSGREYLLFLFTAIMLGVKHLYKADTIFTSEVQLAKIMGFKQQRFPSARGLYRVLETANHWSVKRLEKVSFSLLRRQRDMLAKKRWLTADIDQTKKLTEGKTIEQAKPCYAASRKGKLGLRLSAMQVEGLVLSQKLEPGNVGNSDAFKDLFTDTLDKLNRLSHPIRARRIREKKLLLRIDGGYFSAATLLLLEELKKKRRFAFIIRCRSDLVALRGKNHHWRQLDDEVSVVRLTNIQVLPAVPAHYTVLLIRQKQVRIISKKKRIRTKTVYLEYALVTTLSSWQNRRIIKLYKQRQTIEDIFKDFNQSFEAETLPSRKFWGNALYFQMVALAHNVSIFLKQRLDKLSISDDNDGDYTGQFAFSSGRNFNRSTGYQN